MEDRDDMELRERVRESSSHSSSKERSFEIEEILQKACSQFIKSTFVLFGIAVSMLVVFAIMLYTYMYSVGLFKPVVCASYDCQNYAQNMIFGMDREYKKCSDFFHFMCGNVHRDEHYYGFYPQNETQSKVLGSSFLYKNDNTPRILEKEEITTKEDQFWMAFHEKCQETGHFQKQHEELEKAVRDVDSWPSTNSSWNEKKFNLSHTLFKIANFGVGNFGIFKIKLSFDFGKYYGVSKIFIINTKGRHGREDLSNYEGVGGRNKHLENDRAAGHNISDEVKTFAERLEKIGENVSKRSDQMNGGDWASLKDLEKWVPAVEWRSLLNSLVPEEHDSKTVDWDDLVMIYPREYFEKNLQVLLTETKATTLANYLQYNSMMEVFKFLPAKNESARHCDKILDEILPIHFEPNHVLHTIPYQESSQRRNMAEEVKQEFILLMKDNEWMDEQSKKEAITKLEKMTIEDAFHKKLATSRFYEERYKNLEVSKNQTYFALLLDVLRWEMKTLMLDIVRKDELYVSRPWLEEEYNPILNKFVFGLKVDLRWETMELPAYYDYATAGFKYASIMAGMFDDIGIKWKATIRNEPMFTNETLRKFNEKKNCVLGTTIDYRGEEVEQLLGAYMKEYVGLQVGWRLLKKAGQQERFFKFQDTEDEKMFFYCYAQKFCDSYKMIHVNHILPNFPGFEEAFSCGKGSPMYRENKCTLF